MTDSTQSPLSGLYMPSQLERLYYGPGSVKTHLLSALPSPQSKVFIITGTSLATKSPLISEVEQLLGHRHAGTFSGIRQHAPVADLDAATEKVLADPAIDTIVSIGGGSPIDSAKAIAYRLHEKSQDPAAAFLYHIAIPTTLSVAEVTQSAGFSSATGDKIRVADPHLVPKVIIYDSTFIHPHTPPTLFLSTGMRAMDHAMEILNYPLATELTKKAAVTAAADLFAFLPRYKADPTDHDVITSLQLAAYTSLGKLGLNLRGKLGISHTLGYALGGPYGIPHGITSCLTLGKVIQLKASKGGDTAAQICRACAAAGVQRTGDDVRDATEVGKAIERLVRDIGLNKSLDEYKVGRDQVGVIVRTGTGEEGGPRFDEVYKLVETLW